MAPLTLNSVKAPFQEVAVGESIAPDIPTANQPPISDAPPLGVTHSIVRLNDRGAEGAVSGADKTAGDAARVDNNAGDVAAVIDSFWDRLSNVAIGVINRRDDLN